MTYAYVKAENLWSWNEVAMKQEVLFWDFSESQLDTRGIWTYLEGRYNVVNKRLAELISCSVVSEIRKHEATSFFSSHQLSSLTTILDTIQACNWDALYFLLFISFLIYCNACFP